MVNFECDEYEDDIDNKPCLSIDIMQVFAELKLISGNPVYADVYDFLTREELNRIKNALDELRAERIAMKREQYE
jgi:hypothetical protein